MSDEPPVSESDVLLHTDGDNTTYLVRSVNEDEENVSVAKISRETLTFDELEENLGDEILSFTEMRERVLESAAGHESVLLYNVIYQVLTEDDTGDVAVPDIFDGDGDPTDADLGELDDDSSPSAFQ